MERLSHDEEIFWKRKISYFVSAKTFWFIMLLKKVQSDTGFERERFYNIH